MALDITETRLCLILYCVLKSIAMFMPVCLSVCLSARITREPHDQTSPILCMLPLAVARSSDGVAIRYVLPVLQMTSCFHTMGPVARIKHDASEVRQVAVAVGRQTQTRVFV